jgi:FkbM family methyltransferase
MRALFLFFLKITSFDFKLRHHYTNFKFELNSYVHKGYWYHGSKREINTINHFQRLINPGDRVIEVGAHIGYFSTLFAKLVGREGRLIVFEPSKENLSYLEKNISFMPLYLQTNVTVVAKGVGDVNGSLDFYLDPITGQNNSFVKDFNGFIENRKFSAEKEAIVEKVKVPIIRLDDFLSNNDYSPTFIKIDVEGYELNVIKGMRATISNYRPNLMIEIQKDEKEIIDFFIISNYHIFNDYFSPIYSFGDYLKLNTPNMFFLSKL